MRNRQLTPDYELKMRNDTIEAYFYYFGRSYIVTILSNDGGIQFKTANFKYTSMEAKKGLEEIIIVPKNSGDTHHIALHVSQDGFASLQVASNNRQAISFNGYIH